MKFTQRAVVVNVKPIPNATLTELASASVAQIHVEVAELTPTVTFGYEHLPRIRLKFHLPFLSHAHHFINIRLEPSRNLFVPGQLLG